MSAWLHRLREQRYEKRLAAEYERDYCTPPSPEMQRRMRMMRLAEKGQALGWCPVCGRGDVAVKPFTKATGAIALACTDEHACARATATRPPEPGKESPLWRSDNWQEAELAHRRQQLREDLRNPEPLRQEVIRQIAEQRKAARRALRNGDVTDGSSRDARANTTATSRSDSSDRENHGTATPEVPA